jgi:hypothetical protein
MERISGGLLKRIQDPQPVVASAAHIAVSNLLKVCLLHVNILSQRLTVFSGLPVVSGPSLSGRRYELSIAAPGNVGKVKSTFDSQHLEYSPPRRVRKTL